MKLRTFTGSLGLTVFISLVLVSSGGAADLTGLGSAQLGGLVPFADNGPQNGEVNHFRLDQYRRVLGAYEYVGTIGLYLGLDDDYQAWFQDVMNQWIAESCAHISDWGFETHRNDDGSITIVATGPFGRIEITVGPFLPVPTGSLPVRVVSASAYFMTPQALQLP